MNYAPDRPAGLLLIEAAYVPCAPRVSPQQQTLPALSTTNASPRPKGERWHAMQVQQVVATGVTRAKMATQKVLGIDWRVTCGRTGPFEAQSG
jgi:hypothetical protein